MKLAEFADKMFAATTNPPTMYVFDNENCADMFVESLDNREGGLVCTIKTELKLGVTMNERICNAKVYGFYAIGWDELVVIIDEWEKRDG